MRRSQTAPTELFADLSSGPYASEPFEAGWAAEAIAFVYVREAGNGARLTLRAQISADGQRWIDHGAAFPEIGAPGGYALSVRHFGNWLRLAGEVQGVLTLDIYWHFKE